MVTGVGIDRAWKHGLEALAPVALPRMISSDLCENRKQVCRRDPINKGVEQQYNRISGSPGHLCKVATHERVGSKLNL